MGNHVESVSEGVGDEVVVSYLKELTDSSRFIAATPGPAANSRETWDDFSVWREEELRTPCFRPSASSSSPPMSSSRTFSMLKTFPYSFPACSHSQKAGQKSKP